MARMQNDCHGFQLIDGKGEFKDEELLDFITATNLSQRGVDYAVIAIIGPQSSGKSTFLNHFGGTNFTEMDSQLGRKQTTQGIWISKCVTFHQPFTIAMDIEGTDGRERNNGTSFEGKSALFALAVADILIVNLWEHDIGRQQAASIPLLETVLEIRVRMDTSHKPKLVFLIRDKSSTPFGTLEKQVKSTMEEIWTTIPRSNGFERGHINDFFRVEVFGLPHYKFEREEFVHEVAKIREIILSYEREGVVPAIAFQTNAQQLWKTINEEPFLNLPTHSEMIAKHMCKEIANTCLKSLASSEDLMELKKEVEAGHVSEFREKLHSLMETTLSKYLNEVQHFEEQIVKERAEVLKSGILNILHPLYVTNMEHLRDATFQEFKMRFTTERMEGEAYRESYDVCKRMFEEQCQDIVEQLSAGWDWLGCKKELCHEIESYVSSIRREEYLKRKVSGYITKSLDELQDLRGETFWAWITLFVRKSTSECNGITYSYADATEGKDTSLNDKMTQELQAYARNVVVDKLRGEADESVVKRMIIRFGSVFCWDEDSIQRNLVDLTENKEDICQKARTAAIKLLSAMAVVKFDHKSNNWMKGGLLSSLTHNHSDINKWEGVSEEDTIFGPWKCKSLLRQFNATVADLIMETMADLDNIKRLKGKETMMGVMYVVSALLQAAGGMLSVVPGHHQVAGVVLKGTFMTVTHFIEKEKQEARQEARDIEKSCLQRLHKRFHCGQLSLQ